jgi:hypothetical protein
MSTPTPNQLRRMLAHVNAELSREADPARASDLRILKMKIETAIALAEIQGAAITPERAPPRVTVH